MSAWRAAATGRSSRDARSGSLPGTRSRQPRVPVRAAARRRAPDGGAGTPARRAAAGRPRSRPSRAAITCSPAARTLPGWKSPWTSVSGRPHAATSSKRAGRPAAKAASASRSGASSSGAAAVDEPLDGRGQGRPAPVGESERQERIDLVDLGGLDGHEGVDHPVEQRAGRVVLVLAGQLGHELRWPSRAEERRDRPAGQALEDGALVGEERRHGLEPRARPVGQGQGPQARQVPGPDLARRPGARQPARGEDALGPGQVGGRAARSRPGHPLRVVGRAGPATARGEGPPPRRPGRPRRGRSPRRRGWRHHSTRGCAGPSGRRRSARGRRRRPARPPATTGPPPRRRAGRRGRCPRGSTRTRRT